jgi:peptide-methionine (S)-S-oxide reductase
MEPILSPAHITLGGGCFWCVEAAFSGLRGVQAAVSGYAQGQLDNPSYEQVCSGRSGHAEVVRVSYDPARLDLDTLLQVFFTIHDPTTPNRQGADVGTQYRSGIYVDAEAELAPVRALIAALQPRYAAPIVTETAVLRRFWPAEAYHQRYFERHPGQGYCQVVIAPKLDKLRQRFAPRLRNDAGDN